MAEQSVAANQVEQARAIVTRLNAAVGAVLDDKAKQRLASLDAKVKDLAKQQPAPPEVTPAPANPGEEPASAPPPAEAPAG